MNSCCYVCPSLKDECPEIYSVTSDGSQDASVCNPVYTMHGIDFGIGMQPYMLCVMYRTAPHDPVYHM